MWKGLAIATQAVGALALLLGASGADTVGVADKLWMALAIIGVLLIVLGRAWYQYLVYIRQERFKKSRRYQKYLENEKKMSA